MTGITLYRVEVDEYDGAYGFVNRKAVSRDCATAETARAWAKELARLNPGRQFHTVRVDTDSVADRSPDRSPDPITFYAEQMIQCLDRQIALGDGTGERKMTVENVQPEVNKTMTDRPAPGKPTPLPENCPAPPDMRYRVEWMDYADPGEQGGATAKVMTFAKTDLAARQAAESLRNAFTKEAFRVVKIGGGDAEGASPFSVARFARGTKVKVTLTDEEAGVSKLPHVFYATFLSHEPGNWAEVAITSGVIRVRPGRLSPHDGVPDLSAPAPPTPGQAEAIKDAFTRCPECDGTGVSAIYTDMPCQRCQARGRKP